VQAERVVLAQVGLGGERQPYEVVEAADVLRLRDAGGAKAFACRRDAFEEAIDQRAQALELQRLEALARAGLDLR